MTDRRVPFSPSKEMHPHENIGAPKEGLAFPKRIKVLSYHRVYHDGEEATDTFSVPESIFRKQMRFLDRMGFKSITFEDYRLFCRGERNLPQKSVMITFDDGYRDIYDVAYPILKEMAMRAVIFVVADPDIKVNTWDQGRELAGLPLMDKDQIVDLHNAGFEIGSHTLTHPVLTRITSSEAWREISRSRTALETLLDAPVYSFAYPFGALTPETKEMVLKAGYAAGFGGWSGPVFFGQDSYEIRRILIDKRIGMLRFAVRILTPFEQYRWGRWQLRRILGDRNST